MAASNSAAQVSTALNVRTRPSSGSSPQRQRAQLVQEPRVDAGAGVQRGHVVAAAEGLEHQLVAVPGRDLQRRQQRLVVRGRRGAHVQLARAPGLHPRLLERAADGHRLADRLHVGGQRRRPSRGTSRTRTAAT